MIKQDFVLTELEALAKDIGTLVSEQRKLLEEQERSRFEMKKAGQQPVTVAPYNPNKFIPEITYFQVRLDAVRQYLAEDLDKRRI